MNHRPFEDWLLNEQPLNSEQKRQLQAHLLDCAHCAALAEINLELRTARLAAPAPGFTARFRERLAAQRVRERRSRLIGALILLTGGSGLLGWRVGPYLLRFLSSPAGWIAAFVNFCLTLLDMARAVGSLVSIFLRLLPDFIPPFGWMVIFSALSGMVLLWTVSLWRFSRFAKGA